MPTETLLIDTADGLTLHAELALPAGGAWAAAVVCHPHPLYGGDMHNSVVDALFRVFHGEGIAVVRFDFRGVGRSEGTHGNGIDERLDVSAAIDAISPLCDDGPLVLAGYSFGAAVALDVVDARLDAWVAVAPPLAAMGANRLAAGDHRPKLVLAPQHDQFTPPDAMRAAVAGWTATTVEDVEMADHFLAGRAVLVAERAAAFVHDLAKV